MKPRISSSLKPSLLFCLFNLFATLTNICYAQGQCDVEVPDGDVIVSVTDPRIQYFPSLDDDTQTWKQFSFATQNETVPGVLTSSDVAQVSLTFQGSSLKVYAISTSRYPPLAITLDGDKNTFPGLSVDPTGELRIRQMTLGWVNLDPTINHTVVIRKGSNATTDFPWHFLALSFTPSTAINGTAPISPILSSKLSGGAISGIVIGAVIGVGLVGTLFVCLRIRSRRRQIFEAPSESLMTSPVTTSTDQSLVRGLNPSRLAFFAEPPSILSPFSTHATGESSSIPVTFPTARPTKTSIGARSVYTPESSGESAQSNPTRSLITTENRDERVSNAPPPEYRP